MKILLGVCGSISCFKSFEVLRGLVKEGHEVRVVITQGALRFIKPDLFHYLGAKNVYGPGDDFVLEKNDLLSEGSVLHINLAKWCDRLVIVGGTANTLGKLAHGFAEDLLQSIYLCLEEKLKIIFLAMNTSMYENSRVIANQTTLESHQSIFFKPDRGLLACGDEGLGKLPPVEKILILSTVYRPVKSNPLKILITTGATLSPLDPVRYLTNPSSGATGLALACHYLALGHEVQVILGSASKKVQEELSYLQDIPQFELFIGETTKTMRELALKHFPKCDLYISAAAINDIEFQPQSQKIKKKDLQGQIPISPSPDVLAEVLSLRKGPHPLVVGFAAETTLEKQPSEEHALEFMLEKWGRKPVDLLIGNFVSNGLTDSSETIQGFQGNSGHYYFLKAGKIVQESALSKKHLGPAIDQLLRNNQWN